MIERLFRRVLATCVLTAALCAPALAQTGKPVTIVVPYAAGGGTDTVTR